MKVISVKRGFGTDHSSTHTEYIRGFTVTCDYDWWTCKFNLPYKKSLFEKIKKYEAFGDYQLAIEKSGNVISIDLCVHLDYGSIGSKSPFIAFANACARIRENILNGDFSDLELLQAYVEDEHRFYELESSSNIEDIIGKAC